MAKKTAERKPFEFPTYNLDALRSRPLPVTGEEELLAMAGAPETDPELLLTIWLKSRCTRIMHALARNPSTPVTALLRLWALDPGAVLENPITLLWEFTKPRSAQKILPASLQFTIYQYLLDKPEFVQHSSYIAEEEVVRILGKKEGFRLRVPVHWVVRDQRRSVRLALLQQTVQYQAEQLGRPLGFPHNAIEDLASDTSKPVLHALAVALAKRWILPEPLDASFILRLGWHLHAEGGASIARPIAKWPFLGAELVERLAKGADDELLAGACPKFCVLVKN